MQRMRKPVAVAGQIDAFAIELEAHIADAIAIRGISGKLAMPSGSRVAGRSQWTSSVPRASKERGNRSADMRRDQHAARPATQLDERVVTERGPEGSIGAQYANCR